MRSVRTRITVVAALLCGVVLVAASVLLVMTLERSLVGGSDDVSRAQLAELAERAQLDSVFGRLPDAGEGVVQVVSAGGAVVAASPNVFGRPAITDVRAQGETPSLVVVRNAPDDGDREDYRVWAQRVEASGGPVTIYVGQSLEAVHEATATLRAALAAVVPATLGLLVLAIWYLIGRALRPVETIRAEVSAITQTSLSRRVPVPATGDEVAQLAQTMNHMLERLQTASERERTFVADASHELLSPLAASRAMLETAPPGREWHDLTRELLRENSTMDQIVRDLLFLARDQTGHSPQTHPVDIDDLVLEEAARARPTTDVDIDTSAVSAGPTIGDREELRRLVRNLLDNATRHAQHLVTLKVGTRGSTVTADIIDDGPGIPAGTEERVFDRFYRGDPTRARSSPGFGLGLAIARTIARSHGGTLDVVDAGTPGAHFRLALPRDPNSAERRTAGRPMREQPQRAAHRSQAGPRLNRPR